MNVDCVSVVNANVGGGLLTAWQSKTPCTCTHSLTHTSNQSHPLVARTHAPALP